LWGFATPDDSFEEIQMTHVLEHLGATSAIYLGIMKELWRVGVPGALIRITVPHPRHDSFLIDPTHVRPITAEGLQMFSKAKNREWVERRSAHTPLGLHLGIDLEIVSISAQLDEPWHSQVGSGKMSQAELELAIRSYNNVIAESTIVLRAVKAAA
jgi:hypothetical protein